MKSEENLKMNQLLVSVRTSTRLIKRLKSAIKRAEKKFRFYAELHARKGTPQGFQKASQNRKMALDMRKALDL